MDYSQFLEQNGGYDYYDCHEKCVKSTQPITTHVSTIHTVFEYIVWAISTCMMAIVYVMMVCAMAVVYLGLLSKVSSTELATSLAIAILYKMPDDFAQYLAGPVLMRGDGCFFAIYLAGSVLLRIPRDDLTTFLALVVMCRSIGLGSDD